MPIIDWELELIEMSRMQREALKKAATTGERDD